MKDKRKFNVLNRDQVYLYMAEESPVVSNSCNDCDAESNPVSACQEVPVSVCGNCSEGTANNIIIDCLVDLAVGCFG